MTLRTLCLGFPLLAALSLAMADNDTPTLPAPTPPGSGTLVLAVPVPAPATAPASQPATQPRTYTGEMEATLAQLLPATFDITLSNGTAHKGMSLQRAQIIGNKEYLILKDSAGQQLIVRLEHISTFK